MNITSGMILLMSCAGAGGLVLSALFTMLCRRLAFRFGVIDAPESEEHKRHGKATPLLGGVAMSGAFICVIACGYAASAVLPCGEFSGGMNIAGREMAFITLGGLLSVALGTWDDVRSMKAHWKFLGQLAVALLAVGAGGVRISIFVNQNWFVWTASVCWFMLIFNAVNFFDNMDGLAAGTICIAMAFFSVISVLNGQFLVGALAALSCGVCGGFWIFNAAPASIFMGDGGSLFLGFLAAVISAKVSYFNWNTSLSFFPILLPVFILSMPVFDALTVFVIRCRAGKPFWVGDNNHISHRFAAMGLDRKNAVRAVHLLSLIVALGALPLLRANVLVSALLCLQLLLLFALVLLLQFSAKR